MNGVSGADSHPCPQASVTTDRTPGTDLRRSASEASTQARSATGLDFFFVLPFLCLVACTY